MLLGQRLQPRGERSRIRAADCSTHAGVPGEAPKYRSSSLRVVGAGCSQERSNYAAFFTLNSLLGPHVATASPVSAEAGSNIQGLAVLGRSRLAERTHPPQEPTIGSSGEWCSRDHWTG